MVNEDIRKFVILVNRRFRDKCELRDIRLRLLIVLLCTYDEPLTHTWITKLLATTDKTSRRLRTILVDTGYATAIFKDREVLLSPTQKAIDLVS